MQVYLRFARTRMQASTQAAPDELAGELAARVLEAGGEAQARSAYAQAFEPLRAALAEVTGARPSLLFEAGARIVRNLAAACLPLGIAVTMHLYPVCALQCIPLPRLSFARLQRAMLLRAIKSRRLIVANAGSERACGLRAPLVATADASGVRIDGTCEYVSLASVADLVLFHARLASDGRSVLCAADFRADSVRIGGWKFQGHMRLSDTAPVAFVDHLVPHGRYLIAPGENSLLRASEYQRCWFHLFLAEIYLARIAQLRLKWELASSVEHIVSLNEMVRLREYSLRLLDDFCREPNIEALLKTTSALKLRASFIAQATSAALNDRAHSRTAVAEELRADALELGYIRWQPTADEKILREIALGDALHSPVVLA